MRHAFRPALARGLKLALVVVGRRSKRGNEAGVEARRVAALNLRAQPKLGRQRPGEDGLHQGKVEDVHIAIEVKVGASSGGTRPKLVRLGTKRALCIFGGCEFGTNPKLCRHALAVKRGSRNCLHFYLSLYQTAQIISFCYLRRICPNRVPFYTYFH